MPGPRSYGAYRKIFMEILQGCLILRPSRVPVPINLTQTSNRPLKSSDADYVPAQERTASVAPYLPAQPASPVNVSPATDTGCSSFTDTRIGSQSKSGPPPTLSGLPDPSTTLPIPISPVSNQAPVTAQAGAILLPGWNLISISDLITDTTHLGGSHERCSSL